MGMGGRTREFSHWQENLNLPVRKRRAPSVGRITGRLGAILLIALVTAIMWITGCAGLTSGTAQALTPSGLSITTSSLSGATVGTAYSATLQASGGTSPDTWSVSIGALPAGLSLAALTGVISGTPTASGSSSFTIQAADSANSTSTKELS